MEVFAADQLVDVDRTDVVGEPCGGITTWATHHQQIVDQIDRRAEPVVFTKVIRLNTLHQAELSGRPGIPHGDLSSVSHHFHFDFVSVLIKLGLPDARPWRGDDQPISVVGNRLTEAVSGTKEVGDELSDFHPEGDLRIQLIFHKGEDVGRTRISALNVVATCPADEVILIAGHRNAEAVEVAASRGGKPTIIKFDLGILAESSGDLQEPFTEVGSTISLMRITDLHSGGNAIHAHIRVRVVHGSVAGTVGHDCSPAGGGAPDPSPAIAILTGLQGFARHATRVAGTAAFTFEATIKVIPVGMQHAHVVTEFMSVKGISHRGGHQDIE